MIRLAQRCRPQESFPKTFERTIPLLTGWGGCHHRANLLEACHRRVLQKDLPDGVRDEPHVVLAEEEAVGQGWVDQQGHVTSGSRWLEAFVKFQPALDQLVEGFSGGSSKMICKQARWPRCCPVNWTNLEAPIPPFQKPLQALHIQPPFAMPCSWARSSHGEREDRMRPQVRPPCPKTRGHTCSQNVLTCKQHSRDWRRLPPTTLDTQPHQCQGLPWLSRPGPSGPPPPPPSSRLFGRGQVPICSNVFLKQVSFVASG